MSEKTIECAKSIKKVYDELNEHGYSEEGFLEFVEVFLDESAGTLSCGYGGYSGEEKISSGQVVSPIAVCNSMIYELANQEDVDELIDFDLLKEKEKILFFFMNGMRSILKVKPEDREKILLRYFCVAASLAFAECDAILKEYFDKVDNPEPVDEIVMN